MALTHAMRQTAVDEAVAAMRRVLIEASYQFKAYAKNHMDKSPPDYEKALTNLTWAKDCDDAVKLYDEI